MSSRQDRDLRVLTFTERPDLESQLSSFGRIWPEFIFHGGISLQHYHHTNSTFAEYHLYVVDGDDQVLVAAVAVPLAWDGASHRLPSGWDAALERAVEDHEANRAPTALCALGAMVRQEQHRKGLGGTAIWAMKQAAMEHGYGHLVAPVRPTVKSRYPLTPIERYMTWRRADGSAFDPWIRTHERVGGRIVKAAPRSMVIDGSVAEWESWTTMEFPDSGEYIVPGALAPITIDRDTDRGHYVEPNVWMVHPVSWQLTEPVI